MNWSALIHATLLLVVGGEITAALSEPLIGAENGLVSLAPKDGQRMGPFLVPLDSEGALEATNHEPNNGKSVKTHLLAQQEFPLLIADHYSGARLPYSYGKLSSKYLLKPIRELNVANSLFSRGEEMSTSRARRYAYPMASQSFLRFGRRNKRPRDAKDTAFLRFGRSEQQDRAELESASDSTGLP